MGWGWRSWRSFAEAVIIPTTAVGVALLLFGLFCYLAGADPLAVYASIHRAGFSSWFSWQNTLLQASPLLLSALCTLLPSHLGLIIIGNEGALILGGLGAAMVGLAPVPGWLALGGMAVVGMTCGGLWILLAGALRYFRGVNETISSLLLNYIAIAFFNQLVEGPWRDPSSLNKPSTFSLPTSHLLGTLADSRLHAGLPIGLLFCALAAVFIYQTTMGFGVRVIGGNPRVAKMMGLSIGHSILLITFAAGACAGLAGMVEVAAVLGRANDSLAANYGYSGILVAFMARQQPLAVIPVAVLMGGILASGSMLQRAHQLPDATVLVFQGMMFVTILWSETMYRRFSWFRDPVMPDVEVLATAVVLESEHG